MMTVDELCVEAFDWAEQHALKTPPERDLHTIKFVGPRGQPPPFPMIPSPLPAGL